MKGREPPQWYVEEPLVDTTGRFYLDAFFELSSDRPADGKPIPRRDIYDHADRLGLQWGVARVFAIVIRRLDFAYTDWAKDQRESSSG